MSYVYLSSRLQLNKQFYMVYDFRHTHLIVWLNIIMISRYNYIVFGMAVWQGKGGVASIWIFSSSPYTILCELETATYFDHKTCTVLGQPSSPLE